MEYSSPALWKTLWFFPPGNSIYATVQEAFATKAKVVDYLVLEVRNKLYETHIVSRS